MPVTVGKVWLVGAGPGDPGLITVRGRQIVAEADVVLHDALAHSALLDTRPEATIIDVGKRYGRPSADQGEIIAQLIRFARQGKRVVRLKGGDPYLFARGAEEALALAEAGVPFEVVPGVSSPVGTTTYAGFPLTHRTLSSSVMFITGSDRQGVEWDEDSLRSRATASDTLCILMGMRRLAQIADALIGGGRPPDTPAAVVQWGARPQQRTAVATLSTIAAEANRLGLTNPAVIVVGEVVRLRDMLRWYDTQPLFGQRIVVPRAPAQATETARSIRVRGAEPLCVPAIEIQAPADPAPLEAALARLGSYRWVVFTSANGVGRTFDRLGNFGLDARAFGASRIAAIGPKTAKSLADNGIRADVIADQYVGEALAEAILEKGAAGSVLVVRAQEARETLPDMLRASGALVDVVAAYRTVPVAGVAQAELRQTCRRDAADVILFTSSSMVTSVLNALGEDGPAILSELTVASIGPITTRTAEQLGVRVDVTASIFTLEGLLDALEVHLLGKRPQT